MTPRERRTFLLAAALLLAASLARYGFEMRRSAPLLPPDSAGVRDELLAAASRARAEAELRQRPLEAGERLDPNRASAAELDRLPGVGPAVADAIVRERRDGGWFTAVPDLERVRGIGPATLARMADHLDLERPPPLTGRRRRDGGRAGGGADDADPGGFRPLVRTPPPSDDEGEAGVELNGATAADLEGLSGIGPALAGRIVELRREKGRFRRVDELLEVRGIGPATLERLRPRIRVRP